MARASPPGLISAFTLNRYHSLAFRLSPCRCAIPAKCRSACRLSRRHGVRSMHCVSPALSNATGSLARSQLLIEQMDIEINIPSTAAEVAAAFRRYEAALISNDIMVLNELFWDAPHIVRFG